MRRILWAVPFAVFTLASCQSETAPSPTSTIQGDWQLQAFQLNDGTVVQVSDPDNYTIEFTAQGQAHVKADCNRCNGPYQTDGDAVTIQTMACTLAACPPDSFHDRYTAALGTAWSFVRADDALAINYQGGTMQFSAN
jgi:heat shock protein HslJ